MRKQQEEPARKSVHARLILDAVAERKKIEVDRRGRSMSGSGGGAANGREPRRSCAKQLDKGRHASP